MKKCNQYFTKTLFTLIFTLFFYINGYSCSTAPPTPPPFTITTCSVDVIEITFCNYKTFGSVIGQNCACGLVLPSIITEVLNVEIIDSVNNPLPQFTFSTNSTTTTAFNGMAPANWSGFLSGVSASIAANISIKIRFTVRVSTCVTVEVIDSVMALTNALGTAGADGTGNLVDHISILQSGSGSLPIELNTFQGYFDGQDVNLLWETVSENNNDYFSIEKSSDGINFKEISQMEGAGDSYTLQEYAFLDAKPEPGLYYYRLKQIDFDGQSAYSNVIVVEIKGSYFKDLRAAPSPTSDRVNLSFSSEKPESLSIEVYDFQGKRLMTKAIRSIGAKDQGITLDLSFYESGIYQIILRDEFHHSWTTRVLKL